MPTHTADRYSQKPMASDRALCHCETKLYMARIWKIPDDANIVNTSTSLSPLAVSVAEISTSSHKQSARLCL